MLILFFDRHAPRMPVRFFSLCCPNIVNISNIETNNIPAFREIASPYSIFLRFFQYFSGEDAVPESDLRPDRAENHQFPERPEDREVFRICIFFALEMFIRVQIFP